MDAWICAGVITLAGAAIMLGLVYIIERSDDNQYK